MVGIRGYLVEMPTYNLQINEPYMIRYVEEGSDTELQIYMTN